MKKLILLLFIPLVSFGQNSTYTITEKPSVYPNKTTYEVKKKDDISTQLLNHSRNLNSIRNRVRGEINDIISNGQSDLMDIKLDSGNINISNLYFKAQKKAFEKMEDGRTSISLGLMSKYDLPKYINKIKLNFTQLIYYLDLIGGLSINDEYQKSINYVKEFDDEFNIELEGAIYDSKPKLNPSEFYQYVYESHNGKLNEFEKSWDVEVKSIEEYNKFRIKIISERDGYLKALENNKARRIFINKELEWASKKVGFYWRVKGKGYKPLRLINILNELNFSTFNNRPKYEIKDLTDRELIVDYVRFMRKNSSVDYSQI